MTKLPDWPEAEKGLRFSIEKLSRALHEVVFEPVTDTLGRVLVHEATPLTREQLKTWHCTLPKALRIAGENMTRLLASADIAIEEGVAHVEGRDAASLVLAPDFGETLSKRLGGWPLLVVVPTRDHLWAVPERDKDALQRIGSDAVAAHKSSKQKLVLEVVRVSDKGMRTIGTLG